MAARLKRLKGTVAFVTGASSGIGAATARTLAAQGVAVALAARRTERLAHLAQDITSAGGRALSIAPDVSDKAQAQASVARRRMDGGGTRAIGYPAIGYPGEQRWRGDGRPD